MKGLELDGADHVFYFFEFVEVQADGKALEVGEAGEHEGEEVVFVALFDFFKPSLFLICGDQSCSPE